MLLVISGLFFFIVLILLSLLIQVSGDKRLVARTLQVYEKEDIRDVYADEELAKPLHQRVLFPLWQKIATSIGKLTPRTTYVMFAEKLEAAGGYRGMNTNTFLLSGVLIAIVLAIISGFMAGKAFRLPFNQIVGVALLAFVVGMLMPISVLNRHIATRKAAMQKSLPGVLDLIYISVQAGLSFDGALAKVTEKMHGPLVEECARMLQEIRVGSTRRAALKNLSDRCQVQDISLFTAALIQADQLGVSIAQVLKIQASNVRMKRQLTLRELALKAPVKMLLPLVFFIFPTILVVLLGPAIISVFRSMLH